MRVPLEVAGAAGVLVTKIYKLLTKRDVVSGRIWETNEANEIMDWIN